MYSIVVTKLYKQSRIWFIKMVSTNIKTGVDKLVELVAEKKKITVEDAAKKLGVGKDVVQEWAEFLEEEGVITLDYSLSKTWITEKKITKEDVLGTAKEVSSEKEALSRKIDVAISTLQDETSGFENIRKEFVNIQGHIKNEVETVKKQLAELERYDSLRNNIDKDVAKQKQNYESVIKEAEEKLKLESQKYDELKSVIEKERKNLEQYGQKLDELRKLRNDYERTLTSLKESLKNIDEVMEDYRKRFDGANKLISTSKAALDKLSAEISEKKGTVLTKRIQELKLDEEKLVKNQAALESEIKEKLGAIRSYAGIGDKVHKGFDGVFAKNITTEKLIAEIENDKTDLVKDLEKLKTKVATFTMMTNNATIKSELKDMAYTLESFERKKLSIRYKIEKLLGLIKG
jgi:chromosome segregation ATPase